MKTDGIPNPILHLKYPRKIFSLKLMGEQFTVNVVILFNFVTPVPLSQEFEILPVVRSLSKTFATSFILMDH